MRRKKYITGEENYDDDLLNDTDDDLSDDDLLDEETDGCETEYPQTVIVQNIGRPYSYRYCRRPRRCHNTDCLLFTAFVAFACITFFKFKKQ